MNDSQIRPEETGLDTGQPVELYVFQHGEVNYLFTSDAQNVTIPMSDGTTKTFYADTIQRENIKPGGHAVLCFDNENVRDIAQTLDRKVISYAIDHEADYRAGKIEMHGAGVDFSVLHKGKDLGRVRLNLPGRHNVLDALATVVTGLSLKLDNALVRTQLLFEGAIGATGILIVAIAGSVLVRSSLAPLERVARTAQRVASQPLERGEVSIEDRVEKADLDSSAEVGQVGGALNTLLGHVESALAARQRSETQVRQFVADASHELRTPLASIRGYTELIAREGAGAALVV